MLFQTTGSGSNWASTAMVKIPFGNIGLGWKKDGFPH